MHKGVYAGGGGEVWRQAYSKLGVGQHDFGQHGGVENNHFAVGGFVDNQRGAAHFGAGAGGGGNGDGGRHTGHVHPRPVVAHVFKIPQGPCLPGHQCNGFAHV